MTYLSCLLFVACPPLTSPLEHKCCGTEAGLFCAVKCTIMARGRPSVARLNSVAEWLVLFSKLSTLTLLIESHSYPWAALHLSPSLVPGPQLLPGPCLSPVNQLLSFTARVQLPLSREPLPLVPSISQVGLWPRQLWDNPGLYHQVTGSRLTPHGAAMDPSFRSERSAAPCSKSDSLPGGRGNPS